MAFHGPWQGALHGRQRTGMLIALINAVQIQTKQAFKFFPGFAKQAFKLE